MSSQDDWCIKLEAQQAIQRFATLTWNISHLKSLLARHTSELEAIEDAQGEFDLKDSWVRIGESFDLINADTETGVMNQFEKR
ncbi:hypothetical protein GNI_106600 [Gregarina niphandrodes]|uniref:Uncharacterized protein n=1 Tax=Gregarina niphandrodes TaxID=110365 RepID=A0A023B3W3_GRENI|nr:hypothetical protein GNI_106600 [Gregarina niphandrodes]EZG56000.1 hypothetical protein GNI_106600 [Gregarina niphandrodes]|eukprot:XP_011131388.1 hypothetical protein GNI_106600 [Gregarina niphandrodes]